MPITMPTTPGKSKLFLSRAELFKELLLLSIPLALGVIASTSFTCSTTVSMASYQIWIFSTLLFPLPAARWELAAPCSACGITMIAMKSDSRQCSAA